MPSALPSRTRAPPAEPAVLPAVSHWDGRSSAARPDSPAALKRFVEAHFIVPSEIGGVTSPPGRVSIVAHIDGLWNTLTRTSATAQPYSSLLTLPEPYVVPGGRFREMYYWDSYFTMLGLAESGRGDLVKDMVRDFPHLIDTYVHGQSGAPP